MTRIAVTESQARTIQELIAAFPPDATWDGAAYVARHNALPLYNGWTATIGITLDGEIVEWSTDGEFDGLRPVEEPIWVNAALVQGAKAYPALIDLIPSRPSSARTCPDCEGTGQPKGLPELLAGRVGCRCGGVGWFDPQADKRMSIRSRIRDWLARSSRRYSQERAKRREG